jgi:SPP1 gp7 family putative phage head morphogenesis protein
LGDKQISLFNKQFQLEFFNVYDSIALDGEAAFTTLNTEAVEQMINQIWCADGKAWSQRVWSNIDKLTETLNEELIHCVATGAKSTELKRILQERFSVSYSNADMIARTELAHIQTQAAQKRYKDYGIEQVEVWADKDERRCDVCGKLHQTKYPIGAQMPIPAHPRCRCCIVPVVE